MAMGKNIRYLRRARGWSHDILGEKAGTSGQTISQLEKRDSVKSRYAGRIADAFGLPIEWLQDLDLQDESDAFDLLDWFDPLNEVTTPAETLAHIREAIADYAAKMAKARRQVEDTLDEERTRALYFDSAMARATSGNIAPAVTGTRRVPVLSYVQAGSMTEAGGVDLAQVYGDYITTDLVLSDQSFALEIKGDSMVAPPGSSEDTFHEGDRIIVDCQVTPLPGDYVVARNGDHEATFKKYRPRGVDEQGREVFELLPLNPDYPPMRSDRQDIHIIGVMVEHRRYRKR